MLLLEQYNSIFTYSKENVRSGFLCGTTQHFSGGFLGSCYGYQGLLSRWELVHLTYIFLIEFEWISDFAHFLGTSEHVLRHCWNLSSRNNSHITEISIWFSHPHNHLQNGMGNKTLLLCKNRTGNLWSILFQWLDTNIIRPVWTIVSLSLVAIK